ncbi:hypothetical protein D3M49_14255 [Klebsiella pneumoniae]|nr:hypothetical protein [Klebsiella pneumoniae]
MTGVLTGQPLSHEMYIKLPGADVVLLTEGNIIGCDTASATWTRRGLRPWHVNTISTRSGIPELSLGTGQLPHHAEVQDTRNKPLAPGAQAQEPEG